MAPTQRKTSHPFSVPLLAQPAGLLVLPTLPSSVTENQLQEHNLGLPDSFLHLLIHWLLCAVGDQSGDENITQMLKRAHDCRKTAENAAKALLMKLDGSCGGAFAVAGCSVQPWESLSSNSHTRYY